MPSEAWRCSLLHGITVSTFLDLLRLWPNWWPNTFPIESCRCLWEPNGRRRKLQKTYKNITTQIPTSVTNMLQKKGPQKWFVMVFTVPTPGWSSRHPWTGSKAQLHAKMEALGWIFSYFTAITIVSHYLQTRWRCFVYSMNNVLIILDVQFVVVFV